MCACARPGVSRCCWRCTLPWRRSSCSCASARAWNQRLPARCCSTRRPGPCSTRRAQAPRAARHGDADHPPSRALDRAARRPRGAQRRRHARHPRAVARLARLVAVRRSRPRSAHVAARPAPAAGFELVRPFRFHPTLHLSSQTILRHDCGQQAPAGSKSPLWPRSRGPGALRRRSVVVRYAHATCSVTYCG